MDHPDSAVMPFIMGHASGMLRLLYLLEQKGMIAFFNAKDIMQIVVLQRLDVRSIRTQAVFGDDELEVRMVLAQLGNETFGSVTFTIIFIRPIVLPDRFRHQRNHGTHLWMNNRRAQHLMRIRDRPVPMHRVQTRGTVNGRGGKISCAIKG